MSGDKPGATRLKRVVPGLSPRPLAAFTLCPHGVRHRAASFNSPTRTVVADSGASATTGLCSVVRSKRKGARVEPGGKSKGGGQAQRSRLNHQSR